MNLVKVQAASGALFAIFLLLHLTTTSSATLGIDTYDRVLTALRSIYRPALPVELILIFLPLTVHVVCAVVRIVQRIRKPVGKPTRRVRVHRYSGYFLLAVIGGHIFATRVMPALSEGLSAGGADFAYLAFSVQNWAAFIAPYYVVLGIAGAVHLFGGLGIAATVLFPTRFKGRFARAMVIVAIVGASIVTAGVISIIARSGNADETRFPAMRDAYERFMPVMPQKDAS